MHHHHQRLSLPTLAFSLAMLTACSSTPQHTNTLIFGTTTRLAVDISQEPTGAIGATIGYKRLEAVWMPLLANQAASAGGTMQPADCAPGKAPDQTTHCPKFLGKAGDATTNGSGAQDTYSVLATFSGDMGGGVSGAASAPEASANTKVAQFFATGLAARLLAEKGGAALVVANTKSPAEATSDAQVAVAKASVSTEAMKTAATQDSRAATIAIKVSKTDDSINGAALDKLLATDPAKGLQDSVKKMLKATKNRGELQLLLSDSPPKVVSALWQALDAQ